MNIRDIRAMKPGDAARFLQIHKHNWRAPFGGRQQHFFERLPIPGLVGARGRTLCNQDLIAYRRGAWGSIGRPRCQECARRYVLIEGIK